MDAVAQPNPFLLQFLGKARPRTQFDEPWVSNMEAAEQTPIGAYAIRQDIAVPTIILSTGDTEPIAQAVELLRVDRVYDEAPIDQRIDNRSVRHFNATATAVAAPAIESSQSPSSARPAPLCGKLRSPTMVPCCIENTHLVLFRAPVDADKPR